MTLAMYCSFVAALVIPVQVLAVLARRGALRRYGSALVATAVLCVPLAVLAARRGSGQLFWVQPPSRMVDTQVLQSLTSAGLQPVFHHSVTTKAFMWIMLAAVVALVVDTVARWRRGEPVWGMGLVLSWCVVPEALTFLYSVISQPVFVPRNVLMSTPAVALALAPTLGRRRRWPRYLAPALLVVVLAARAIPVVRAYGVSPEPWQAVTASVLAQSRPGDCVTFYPADARMAFQYYVGTGASDPHGRHGRCCRWSRGAWSGRSSRTTRFRRRRRWPGAPPVARACGSCQAMRVSPTARRSRAPIAPGGSAWRASCSGGSAPARCASTATPRSFTSS